MSRNGRVWRGSVDIRHARDLAASSIRAYPASCSAPGQISTPVTDVSVCPVEEAGIRQRPSGGLWRAAPLFMPLPAEYGSRQTADSFLLTRLNVASVCNLCQRAAFLAMSIFQFTIGAARFGPGLSVPGFEFALFGRESPGPGAGGLPGPILATMASNVPPPNCGCAAFTAGKSLDVVCPSTYRLRR